MWHGGSCWKQFGNYCGLWQLWFDVVPETGILVSERSASSWFFPSVISCVARQSRTAEVSHVEPTWMDGTKNSRVKKKDTFLSFLSASKKSIYIHIFSYNNYWVSWLKTPPSSLHKKTNHTNKQKNPKPKQQKDGNTTGFRRLFLS